MKLKIHQIPREAFKIKADFKIHHMSKEDLSLNMTNRAKEGEI